MKINGVPNVSVSQDIAPKVKQPVESGEAVSVQNEVSSMPNMHEAVPKEENGKTIDEELLQKSVDQANRSLKQHNRYIERKVHDVTKAVMYTMKDTETNEVIREFPPERVQDMIAKMWELAGLFVDERG